MMPNIGLLNERALHAELKRWYTRPGDRVEVALDGFVIDIVRDDLLIEIQTGNFSSIKAKLGTLLQSHRVRLFHPIVQEKWIIRSPTPDGGHGRRHWRCSRCRSRISRAAAITERDTDASDASGYCGSLREHSTIFFLVAFSVMIHRDHGTPPIDAPHKTTNTSGTNGW